MENKTTDILFIVPAQKPEFREESICTLILAKKAQLANYNVKILRYWELGIELNDYFIFRTNIIKRIIDSKPKIVSFYCRCLEYHICIDLSKRIKELDSSIKIVFGGPQAELVAKETLKSFIYIDYVCCSEGENTIVPLLDFLISNSKTEKDIKGLTYRDKRGNIFQNEFPEFLPDNYSRDFFYYDLIPSQVLSNSRMVSIDVGRGCPYACTFCSTNKFWKRKFRLRDIDNTLNEIRFVNQTYGIERFDFKHDLFTANKKRILEFCKKLEEYPLKIKWYCDSRINTIDSEMLDVMVNNGLHSIFFGIESGSQRIQELINKNLNLNECDTIIKRCLEKKLKLTVSFIYGFPDETEDDLEKTFQLMVKYRLWGCHVQANMCSIQNGTDLFYKYEKSLSFVEDSYSNIFGYKELSRLISDNKTVFVNFFDYPSPLRIELKFFWIFWESLCSLENKSLALFISKFSILEAYRIFYKSNASLFKQYTSSFHPTKDYLLSLLRKTFQISLGD